MQEKVYCSDDFRSYSVQKFAKEFNISVQTVKAMIKKGNLNFFRWTDKGHYHIPIDEVERFRNLFKKKTKEGSLQQ